MAIDLSLSDIDAQIEIVRGKIFELTERAAAIAGGEGQAIAARQRVEEEFKLVSLRAQRAAQEAAPQP
jgi:hypothetical protein